MATSFYACAGKLDAEAVHISAIGRATRLADHSNASGILTHCMADLIDCYVSHLVDPIKWTISSFHDPTSTALANTVLSTNPQVLKPMDDDENNTAASNRRVANIQYVSISIQVDFSSVTGEQAK